MTGDFRLTPAFHVTNNREGGWEVHEQGIPRSLGRFPTREAACAYAVELSRDRYDARVYVNGVEFRGGSSPPDESTPRTGLA
jgi:anti-sigma-K factor RskA